MNGKVASLPFIREIEEVMHHRVEFVDDPPDELHGVEGALLEAGVVVRDRLWFRFNVAQSDYVYCHCARGQVSSGELYLLRIALSSTRSDVLDEDRPVWETKVHGILQEPIEPFAGPIRIEDELENISVPWIWPIFLIGMRPSNARSSRRMAEVQNTFRSLAETSEMKPYVTIGAAFILAIFPLAGLERESTESLAEETARALVDGLISESFLDVRAVWSPVVHSFPELLRTLKRLVYVAHTAESLFDERRVLSVKGLGIYELIFATKPQFRQAFADHILPPTAVAALGAELEQTVMMFVECDLNMSETARRLYLHRNSLLYRLERIRELTGYDIRRFDDAVTVWAALLLKRM